MCPFPPVRSAKETLSFFFIFFLNTDDLVKGNPCQLNSISECVESFLYIHHADISSVNDDYVFEAMEAQNLVFQKIRLLVSQF